MNFKTYVAIFLLAACLLPANAFGHFIWLERTDGKLEVYFSESAAPGEAELLKLVAAAKVWEVGQKGKATSLKLTLAEESLSAAVDGKPNDSLYVLAHDYGVFSRGDKAMHLQYFAKTGPALGESVWNAPTGKQLDFDIKPAFDGDQVKLTVFYKGQPLEGAEVTVDGQGLKTLEETTNAKGEVTFAPADAGFYYARAKYVVEKPGELDGKK